MAELDPGPGGPGTIGSPSTVNLPGSGTDTQQYELAPGLLQYVQAVYAAIDNSAGADARPTLTISEQSGVVIAKKRQGEAIPAAGSGSATWALRLDDEDSGKEIEFDKNNVGGFLYVDAHDFIEFDAQGATGDFLVFADQSVDIEAGTNWRLVAIGTVNVVGNIITLTAADSLTETAGAGGWTALTTGTATIDADFNVTVNADEGIGFTYGSTYSIETPAGAFVLLIGSTTGHWGDGTHFFVDAGFPFDVYRRDSASDPFPSPRFSVDANGNVRVLMKAGATVSVVSETAGEVFRIDSAGNLQGKTGKALTFNL